MKSYTVYMHTTPNGKRYIGITCNPINERWGKDGSGYKTQLFWRAIQKYGWNNIKHEILYTDLTREEAKATEIELIAKYKSDNPLYGYNQTKGGDHAREGFTTSEKQKQIASDNWRGSKNPNARPVICLETLTIYDTIEDAKKATGASKIAECCKKDDKHKSSGHLHWSYYDENTPLSDYIFLLAEYLQEKSKPRIISERCKRITIERCSIPVICIETGIVYSSMREASKAINVTPSIICVCCKQNQRTAKGFHWKYA